MFGALRRGCLGQNDPRHWAAEGNRASTGPPRRDSRRHRSNRRWVVGLCPCADLVGVLVARCSSPGPVTPPVSSAGPRVRGGAETTRWAPPGVQRPRGADLGGLVHHCDHGSESLAPSPHSRTTRPGGSRLFPGAVGSSYAGAAVHAPGKPLRARDSPWRDGPGHLNRQVCETGTNRARPTRSTTTSHPRLPNTATTTTTPPPRPLRHNQPSIKLRMIRSPPPRCGGRFIRTIRLHPSARQALGSEYE